MIVVSVLVLVSCIHNHILPTDGQNVHENETISPIPNYEFVPGMISKKLYDEMHSECLEIEGNVLTLVQQIQALRAEPISYYEKIAEGIAKEQENEMAQGTTTTNHPNPSESNVTENVTLVESTNNTVVQKLKQQLKDALEQNQQLQKQVNDLKTENNTLNHYLYQFKWKIFLKNVIHSHEQNLDNLELLKIYQPLFQINETLLNETHESWRYDKLAEVRRQRWEFYLSTPPYCKTYFRRLVKRINESEYTVQEFSKAVARFYKIISFDPFLETVKPSILSDGGEYLSYYPKLNFIVPLLTADYLKTTTMIKHMCDEVKSGKPPEIIYEYIMY